MTTPEPEKPPEENTQKKFYFNDVFGFGKIIDKLPLQKLNAAMTYCILASILILSFVGILYVNKPDDAPANKFPSDWDMRLAVIIAVIILGLGIYNTVFKKKK
ncbi:hypothetical protein [Bacillus thuringiensis]|uniref:hypothetical protein n=1 Tax=Bacillus thuringiensis TaxID=1428 RepID=UPI002FBD72EC